MSKAELLDGLQTEYRNWLALLAAIGPEHMDQPAVTGDWSIKDIVAHLTGWRRRTVLRLQAIQRGEPEPRPYWPPELQTDDEINAWIYESRRNYSVRDVLDESDRVFQEMLVAIQGLSDQNLADLEEGSRFLWLEGEPFQASTFFSHFHEEHEPDMRAWLAKIEQRNLKT